MSTPAAWHQDPTSPGRERYWDGHAWTDEYREVMPAADPKAVLDAELAKRVARGWRLVLRESDTEAVIEKGKRPNHVLHLLISVFTIGLWAVFVWLPLSMFKHVKRARITVDAQGAVRVL